VTGEVMANVFGEWRRGRSTCRGGLVFAYQDFWPGAGFGVVDSLGRPKAAYYYLKRALGKLALFASDEGSNGVVLHAINDTAQPIAAQLVVELYRHGQVQVMRIERAWNLAPRSTDERALDQELEHFVDSAYSYRFGPPTYDILVARLDSVPAPSDGASSSTPTADAPSLAEAYFFPAGMALPRQPDIGLRAVARKRAAGCYDLTVTTTGFAQAICIDAPGYTARDNWFHLAPGASRTIQLSAAQPSTSLSATLHALNTYAVSRVALSEE
jgi:beta-mannosidase